MDAASRNRRAMIEKVWAIWITGILQPSLPHDILLELRLTERPAMVTRTLDLYVQRPDLVDQELPSGTQLIDVFDRLDRAILILGAPGAGKTTLLLTLARDLLQRAAQDPEQSIPVIFPLSSWGQQRRPMADWLVDALNEQYEVPRKIGQAWVDANQILPLLDGLDEVKAEHRAACVAVINEFRQDHGLLSLVVCSRVADYEALGTPLRLHGALEVHPLMREQVNSYLAQVGHPMAAVHEAFRDDPTLWELLDTPLMLMITTMAYTGASVEGLRIHGTPAERQQHLFATYVDRMFRHRSAITCYPRQETEQWLAWLAWQMAQHSQAIFYLERMQPDWLPYRQRWLQVQGARWGVGLGVGLLAGLVLGLAGGLRDGLLAGVVDGLGVGLFVGWTADRLAQLLGWTDSEAITTVETIRWSWSAVRLSSVLGSGSVAGLGLGLRVWSSSKDLGTSLVVGLGVSLLVMLFTLLGAGLRVGEIKTKTVPNEAIHRSARMALCAGLGIGLGTGLLIWLFAGPGGGLLAGMGAGLLAGLGAGLGFGGRICLQHFVLRLLLVRNGFAPWRYVDFLGYAVERIFLYKVGNSYMFIHRLLQDYFATHRPELIQDYFTAHRSELGQDTSLECPNCGLLSPLNAMRCDCGYTFVAHPI